MFQRIEWKQPNPSVQVSLMSRFWQHFISNGFGSLPEPCSSEPPPDDEALDCFSRAVVGVAQALRPAMVRLSSSRGAGAGIIFSPDGLVLTSAHLLGQQQLGLRLSDGREVTARPLGSDPWTDLAVVQIQVQGLSYAQLGDSSNLQVGQMVVALGTSPTCHVTVSAGVIGALGQSLPGPRGHVDNLMQTTAVMAEDSRGGPLADSRARIIGINIATTANSLCCALPINMVRHLLPHLLRPGQVTRGYLGVCVRTVSLPLPQARSYGLNQTTVVQVQAIEPLGPADQAGILEGDVLLSLAEQPLTSIEDLYKLLTNLPVDVPAPVVLLRNNRRLERLAMPVGNRQ